MKTRLTEEQTIKILKEHEGEKRAAEIVREHNITELVADLSLDNRISKDVISKNV